MIEYQITKRVDLYLSAEKCFIRVYRYATRKGGFTDVEVTHRGILWIGQLHTNLLSMELQFAIEKKTRDFITTSFYTER